MQENDSKQQEELTEAVVSPLSEEMTAEQEKTTAEQKKKNQPLSKQESEAQAHQKILIQQMQEKQKKQQEERAKKVEFLRWKVKEDVYPFVAARKTNLLEAKDYVTGLIGVIQNASQMYVRDIRLTDLNIDLFVADNDSGKVVREFFVEYGELNVMDAIELLTGLPQVIGVAVKEALKDKTLEDLHVAETLEEQTKDLPTPPHA